jgi:hypothetical protein
MKKEQKPKEEQQSKVEQRRIDYTFPIIIKGKNIEDRAYSEKTVAENVTRRGVFFCTNQPLRPGSAVRIYSVNDLAKTIAKVEVVWVRAEGRAGVGTKLIGSNRSWMKFLLDNSIATIEEQEGK